MQVLLKWWLGPQLTVNVPSAQVHLIQIATTPLHVVLEVTSLHSTCNKLRDCFANLCSKACLSPQLEKGPGLDFSRPADVLVPN